MGGSGVEEAAAAGVGAETRGSVCGWRARADEVAGRIEAAEGRVGEIDAVFARAAFYEEAGRDEVAALQAERREMVAEIERLMGEWEGLVGGMEESPEAGSP